MLLCLEIAALAAIQGMRAYCDEPLLEAVLRRVISIHSVHRADQLGDVYPTTAVLRGGTIYVVHSKLNELIALPPEQKAQLRQEATIRSIARVAP